MSITTQIGLGKRLRSAHMAFSKALRYELAKENVTFGQFVHLERLWDQDGLTQKELSKRVGVETASSTSILAELEELGYVVRKRSVVDGRAINVHLTPAGSALQQSLLSCASRVNARAKRALEPEVVEQLYGMLDAITRELSAAYPQLHRANGKQRLDL